MEIGLVPEIVVYNLEKWKTSGIKICRIKMSGIEYKCGIDFRNVFDKWLWVYYEYIMSILWVYFNDSQREATSSSKRCRWNFRMKWNVMRIMNGPTAGAIAYGLELTKMVQN
jgi:hypothetical protein